MGFNGRITLVDVAEHAGVSRGTASLVVRKSPLVANETRQRVLTSMQQLGYIYHRMAANMRTQRSYTVGLILPEISNPFFAEFTLGVEERLDQDNYLVVLANTSESQEKQTRILTALQEHSAEGIVLCPTEGTEANTLKTLTSGPWPVVLALRYLVDTNTDYVGADNTFGAEMAIEHLIAHGHQRIGFIGGPITSTARYERPKAISTSCSDTSSQSTRHCCPAARSPATEAMPQLARCWRQTIRQPPHSASTMSLPLASCWACNPMACLRGKISR